MLAGVSIIKVLSHMDLTVRLGASTMTAVPPTGFTQEKTDARRWAGLQDSRMEQRCGTQAANVLPCRPPEGLPRRVKGADPRHPPVNRQRPLDTAWSGYARSTG